MILNEASLKSLFQGFGASFTKGLGAADSHYKDISMVVPSSTSENIYGWLGQFPKLREWIGDRVVKNLAAHKYAVPNRKFENTISVPRTSIEDDQFGVFSPIVEELGRASGEFPDELIFELLKLGFQTHCYDGQYFFDIDHPVGMDAATTVSVSNFQAGAGPAWFLLDTSRAIKPMLYQTRSPFNLQQFINETDPNVFWRDEYIYGVRGRANAGFGLWQLAYASKADLNSENYASVRSAMMSLKGDEGRILGIKPTLLVVPPALEEAARILLNNDVLPATATEQQGGGTVYEGGGTNPWKGSANLLVTPWVA